MPYQHANGIRMRYEEWGEGKATLLLLHGLGSCADDWLLQLPAFGPHFRCVPVDLRGHGLSDKPMGSYSVPLFAADVAALMASLNAWHAHVLGLSLGGLVAQQLAVAQPEAVRSLTLINTFPGLWPPPAAMLLTLWSRRKELMRRSDMAQTGRRIAHELFPLPGQELLRAQAEERLAANDPEAYRRAMWAVAGFRPGRSLRRVTCPTLIVACDRDAVVPMAYKERLRHLAPHARFVVIADSGHASNIDQPHAVNQAVLAFLLEVEGGLIGAAGRSAAEDGG